MTKNELRNECHRLISCDKLSDCNDLMRIYLNYLFKVVNVHHPDKTIGRSQDEAKILNQMMFTKIAHLQQVTNGINFESEDGTRLNNIIDPTFVGVLIRNIYETVAMFNLVYINADTVDEKTILHCLWVIAGLRYRQKFTTSITSEENQKKLIEEKQLIDSYIQNIKKTALYKKLDVPNQKKIEEKIKQKDFKVRFNGTNVIFLDWQDLTKTMGIKDSIMKNVYTYFSLYAHPSNVSVFQFADLFDHDKNNFVNMTSFHLRNAFFLTSIFIADYIKLFPNVINTYNSLPQKDQIVINLINIMARGDIYSINDAIEQLN